MLCGAFFMKKFAVILCSVLLALMSMPILGCAKSAERTSYQIDCTLDGYTLKGVERVCFYNHSENTVSELKFNLFGNAFRKDAKYAPISSQHIVKAYPNGQSYGSMSVSSVKNDDVDLEFEICGQDQNVLRVILPREVYPEETVVVDVSFSLDLANVIARTGYNNDTINLANFYPILCALDENGFYECVYYANGDPFYSDCADYSVTLTCDGKYTVASSGSVVSAVENENIITRTYQLSNARSFAFVLSEKFQSVTDTSTGVQINYYYYDDQTPLQSIEYAIKSITTFNDMFGKYPYPTYSVVQTEFVQGGMEYPALVMISDDLTGLPYGEVIVHETAHQWWQTTVGNNEVEYGFLDEGLAEYSVVLFYEKYPDYGYTREALIKSSEQTYKLFCSVYDKLFGKVNTVMLRNLKQFTSEYEYVNMAYIKPCIMYDNLRTTIGDELFFKALKKYYQTYKFKNATPYDLVGAFEKVGADTNGYFQSFFDGKVII